MRAALTLLLAAIVAALGAAGGKSGEAPLLAFASVRLVFAPSWRP